MTKGLKGGVLRDKYKLFSEKDQTCFDDLLWYGEQPLIPVAITYVSNLLDEAEGALKRARIRLEKQVEKQQRRDQKLKGGK